MTITVQNCPFCGSVNVEIDEVTIGEFSVACNECRCVGPIGNDIMEAIADWNRAWEKELS